MHIENFPEVSKALSEKRMNNALINSVCSLIETNPESTDQILSELFRSLLFYNADLEKRLFEKTVNQSIAPIVVDDLPFLRPNIQLTCPNCDSPITILNLLSNPPRYEAKCSNSKDKTCGFNLRYFERIDSRKLISQKELNKKYEKSN